MRRAAKVDSNQSEIVAALRQAGCRVLSLAAVGKGCADLLVYRPYDRLYLLEIKDGSKAPSAGVNRLSDQQKAFIRDWPVYIVTTPEMALEIVGCLKK